MVLSMQIMQAILKGEDLRQASYCYVIGHRLYGSARGRTHFKHPASNYSSLQWRTQSRWYRLCASTSGACLRFQLMDQQTYFVITVRSLQMQHGPTQHWPRSIKVLHNHHSSREAVAAGTARVSKEHTSTNLANIFTKTMAALQTEELLDNFTY